MKRFVDIRGQMTGYSFAWFDTIFDRFEEFTGTQAWNTFAEFEADYTGKEIDRYRRLTPAWAFEPLPEEE